MNGIAYYNGIFSTTDKIGIPLSDRSVFFGDGIYDAALVHRGSIYLKSEHINRFFRSAEQIGLDTSDIKDGLPRLLTSIATMEDCEDSFLYFQLTRNGESRKHEYSEGSSVNLLITLTRTQHPDVTRAIRVSTCDDNRHGLCHIKTLNLLPAVLACTDAKQRGFDEAILIRNGIVTECAHSSLFIVKSEVLITHPLNNSILPGIMRKRIIEIARTRQIRCEERFFDKNELYSADEVFITSSSRLGSPVYQVDEVNYPKIGSSLTEFLLKELYSDYLINTV